MPRLQRILCALDSSDRAPMVLASAAHLAESTGAKLVLFRAISIPVDLPQSVLAVTDARLEDVLIGNARNDLERMAATVPTTLVESIRVMFGTAWDAICREALELDTDLIVIGSHGYSGIDRVLGTTAGKVANHAKRNVLIVRTAI
jgi:universal stress protein F